MTQHRLHTSHEQNRAIELGLDELERVSGGSPSHTDKSRGAKPNEYLTVTLNTAMISS